MNISFGSYKVRVEILIGLVIIFWIMFGHLLCGCCRISLFEGLTNIEQAEIERVFTKQEEEEEEEKEKEKNLYNR